MHRLIEATSGGDHTMKKTASMHSVRPIGHTFVPKRKWHTAEDKPKTGKQTDSAASQQQRVLS